MVDEKAWLQRLKEGDNAAFSQLINAYSRQVINTCYRFLLDRQDAEDAAQEVFIEVFKSVRYFEGNSKFSTWLYRIAITRCLDEIKKRNRKKRLASIGKSLHLDDFAKWISGGTMPDKNLLEKERFEELMHALNTLPDNQRVAFILSKMDGYSNIEIADIMNTTIEAVESLIYRAKRKIGEELKNILKNN